MNRMNESDNLNNSDLSNSRNQFAQSSLTFNLPSSCTTSTSTNITSNNNQNENSNVNIYPNIKRRSSLLSISPPKPTSTPGLMNSNDSSYEMLTDESINKRSNLLMPSTPPQPSSPSANNKNVNTTIDVLMTNGDDVQQQRPQFPQTTTTKSVISRPVTRRGNLLPKSKNFNRVHEQLLQESKPGQFEVDSEANLQRLIQSAPSFPFIPKTPKVGNRGRFPESYVDEEEEYLFGKMSNNSESSDEELSMNSTIIGNNGGAGGSEEMEYTISENSSNNHSNNNGHVMLRPPSSISNNSNNSNNNKSKSNWFEFREPFHPSKASPNQLHTRKLSMNSDYNNELNLLSSSPSTTPQSLIIGNSGGKAPKRKLTESDRFEPYNYNIIKRRAVSPSSSLINSPSITCTNPPNTSNNSSNSSFTNNNNNVKKPLSRSTSPQFSSFLSSYTPTSIKYNNHGHNTNLDFESIFDSNNPFNNNNSGNNSNSDDNIRKSEGVDGISRMSIG